MARTYVITTSNSFFFIIVTKKIHRSYKFVEVHYTCYDYTENVCEEERGCNCIERVRKIEKLYRVVVWNDT